MVPYLTAEKGRAELRGFFDHSVVQGVSRNNVDVSDLCKDHVSGVLFTWHSGETLGRNLTSTYSKEADAQLFLIGFFPDAIKDLDELKGDIRPYYRAGSQMYMYASILSEEEGNPFLSGLYSELSENFGPLAAVIEDIRVSSEYASVARTLDERKLLTHPSVMRFVRQWKQKRDRISERVLGMLGISVEDLDYDRKRLN